MTRKLLCFSLLCFLLSCNRDEPIPAYVLIENVELSTEPLTQGANSHEISEISVSAEGQNLGIYSLPVEIPVLEEGLTNVAIAAVIKQNGQNDERVVYPHYNFLDYDLDLTPTEIREVNPVFEYRDLNIQFQNFDTSISFNDDVNSEGFFDRTTDSDLVFGGTGGSAYSVLDEGGTLFYAETDEAYFWPVGLPVFLEIDYSCNQSFSIGAKATSGIAVTRTELLVVLPTQTTGEQVWRKLYINLTDFVFDNSNAEAFEVYFGFTKNEEEEENPVVYLDNLKVIYP